MEMHKIFIPLLICIGILGFTDSQNPYDENVATECVKLKGSQIVNRLKEEQEKLQRKQVSALDNCADYKELLQNYIQDLRQCGKPSVTNTARKKLNEVTVKMGCGNLADLPISSTGPEDPNDDYFVTECVGRESQEMLNRLGKEMERGMNNRGSLLNDCAELEEFLEQHLQRLRQCGAPEIYINPMKDQLKEMQATLGCGNLAISSGHRYSSTVARQSLIILLILTAFTALSFSFI